MTAIPASFRKQRAFTWVALTLLLGILFATRTCLSFAVSQFSEQLGVGEDARWPVIRAGQVAFALACLLLGPLVDLLGGRRALRIGLIGVVGCNLMVGLGLWGLAVSPQAAGTDAAQALPALRWGLTPASLIPLLTASGVVINGFQAMSVLAIWSIMAGWVRTEERGFFVGLYCLLSPAGRDPAMFLGSLFVTSAYETAFVVPALLLAGVGLFCWSRTKESPQHAGFTDFDTHDAPWPASISAVGLLAPLRLLASSATPWVIALCVVCSAVVQNALFTGLPIQLHGTMGGSSFLKSDTYQLYSSLQSLTGTVGLVLAGLAYDWFRRTRRIHPLSILLLGQALLLFLLWYRNDKPTWVLSAALGTGFLAQVALTVGAKVSGMDFGRRRAVATLIGLFLFAGEAGRWFLSTFLRHLPGFFRHSPGAAGAERSAWPLWVLTFAVAGAVISLCLSRPVRPRQ